MHSQNILRTWRDVWGSNQCLLVLRGIDLAPTALCQGDGGRCAAGNFLLPPT